MSGVFGIAGQTAPVDLAELLGRMGRSLQHRPWMIARSWTNAEVGIGLGHLGIGLFNAGPQPVWNTERTVALVMAGEVDGHPDHPESIALGLYESHGLTFAQHLTGAFVIALWDGARQRVVITNDRFGMYDLFYACRAGRLLFSPELKGILVDPGFPRQIDLTALAQYMRFQHLLGDRTFLEDVRLLPPGSILTFDPSTGALSVKAYWSFANLPNRESIGRAEAAEEAGRLLRLAVRSRSEGRLRPGVFLSGGLDSRTILGLIDRRPVASITFGAPDCRDVHLAARIASVVGSDHHWFDLSDSKWIEEWAPLHLTLTEGQHSWIHAHGISTLAAARQWMDVELTGWDGGTVMGAPGSVGDLQVHAVDDLAFVNRMYSLFNRTYTWRSFSEAEEALLYCEPYRSSLRGRALDSFREEISPYLRFRPDIRGELFYLRNHCARLTHNMVTFRRSHLEVRFPFFDYALIDFLYSIPAQVRGPRQLYRQVIDREVPRLSGIPYDHDELPPTYRQPRRVLHSLGVRLRRGVNHYIQPVFRERSTLYADYEGYLRGGLRPWAEGILFDPRTTGRGLFDPRFVRSVMARHQTGLENNTIGRIAPLITYEMMLRQLMD